MFKVKALALTTFFQAALAATEFSVDWEDWSKINDGKGQRSKNPVKTWSDVGSDKGACKDLCAQYAEENYYEDHFLCSYQDEKPHKCTITKDDDTDSKSYTNWKKIKGTPVPSSLLDDTVDSAILKVFNEAEAAINNVVVTVLTNEHDPINAGYNEEFMVDWKEWDTDLKVKNPVKTWSDVGSDKGACKKLCAQYVEENYYEDNFLCSYQDEKPHKCTITKDDDTKSTEYSNWKKVKGTPKQPGEYAYPLFELQGEESCLGAGVKYYVKVTECYPKNGWDGSLTIGPYTSISSGSFVSPETFVGSVGVVGDISMSKLVCSGLEVSGEVSFVGVDMVSGKGSGTLTASGSGEVTTTMESKECTRDETNTEGILLSPETCDIKLKKEEVNSCNIDLDITITGITIPVGDIVCDILKSDPFDLVESIADAGIDAANIFMTDAFAGLNTGLNTTCIPVSLPNEVSTYDMIIFFDTRFRYTHANLFCIYISVYPRRQTYH